MAKKIRVAIIGDGRIARACSWFLRRDGWAQVDHVFGQENLKPYSLLIGALPGAIGTRCLDAALAWGKDLIDISDVDPPAYLNRLREINRAGITVIPGCGFSPGLVNFILGRELRRSGRIDRVEVEAGSLSPRRCFYPFLWCFEDIVLEHRIPSLQIVGGRKRKLPAFAGYRQERHFGIEAESYYCASGFENLLEKRRMRGLRGFRDFIVRVVRPLGFREFFAFMEKQGLLKAGNFQATKQALEAEKGDNITFARIVAGAGKDKLTWILKARSGKGAELNSMQTITAAAPAVMARMLNEDFIGCRGLLFMDELAQHEGFFKAVLKGVKEKGVRITHG